MRFWLFLPDMYFWYSRPTTDKLTYKILDFCYVFTTMSKLLIICKIICYSVPESDRLSFRGWIFQANDLATGSHKKGKRIFTTRNKISWLNHPNVVKIFQWNIGEEPPNFCLKEKHINIWQRYFFYAYYISYEICSLSSH